MQVTIEQFLTASYPCLLIESMDFDGVEKKVREALREIDTKGIKVDENGVKISPMFATWTITKGLAIAPAFSTDPKQSRVLPKNFNQALEYISTAPESICMLMYNIRGFFSGAVQSIVTNVQALLDASMEAKDKHSCIILVGAGFEVPPEIMNFVQHVDFPLPNKKELMDICMDKIIVPNYDGLNINVPDQEERPERNETMSAFFKRRLLELNKDKVEEAAKSASGLTPIAAENAYALSIIVSGELNTDIIQDQKRQAIRNSEVLEFFSPEDTMNDVGGFGEFKQWLNMRHRAFTDEARDFGVTPPKGILLVGNPGCLSGDTRVNVYRPNGGGARGQTIEELFYRFNGEIREGKNLGLVGKRKQPWAKDRVVEIASFDEETKLIRKNVVEAVVFSGVKPVFILSTEYGYIEATADHPFLTPEGEYVKLCDLRKGDSVVVKGVGHLLEDFRTGRNSIPSQRMISGVGNHPNARVKTIKKFPYATHSLAALVIEADMNNMRLEEFLYALHGDTSELVFLPPDIEIHHKDRNRLNNTLSNLQPLSTSAHARLHMEEDGNLMNKFQTMGRTQKILFIRESKETRTYDISMRAPNHNFVANGFVVHNCGKSLLSKCISSSLRIPLLRFDLSKVFHHLVGASENRMRTALKVIEAVSPCVVWADEIEKALAGSDASKSTDSGVSSRVLGQFLQWRQETKAPVFLCVTCNNIKAIPPEFYRPGRIDAIFYAGLPSFQARMEIASIHLRKRKRDPKSIDLKKIAFATEGFTGAEIELAIIEALFSAFSNNKSDVTTDLILEAVRAIVPHSVRNKEQMEELEEWASNRAKPVEITQTDSSKNKRIISAVKRTTTLDN